EREVIEDFATDGDPDILIVVEKLLTGFDEPRNAVLYIDKQLKDHSIIQAVARVNRLHEHKEYGLLIDYRGVLKALDTAVADYDKLEQDTLAGFEPDDLKGMYRQIDTEYKKLPQLHKALLGVFGDVDNKNDREQYRQYLIPKYTLDEDGDEQDERQDRRDKFYQALTNFGLCLKIALSSSGFYADKSFDETTITLYKKDLHFFNEIRQAAKQDSMQTIDYSAYEKQISALVDKQVVGNEIKESPGVYIVNELGQAAQEQQKATKAANDAANVQSRVKKTIEDDLSDDPYAQKVFSELLKQVIAETEAMFDHPFKQLARFADFEAQVNQRQVDDIPTALTGSKHAQAYYGVFKLALGEDAFTNMIDAAQLVWIERALNVEKIVNAAVVENSLNPQNIENDIRKALLPTLFSAIGLEKAKTVVESVVNITRIGLSKKG
ncbi:MAG: type I restriction endonuclease subunit R, partial [Algicola sp.]|nr:type I restriction endonuclease subunit R [Algicola sp.]